MSALVDITGRRYGRLVVVHLHGFDRLRGKVMWTCQCDCGDTKVVRASSLSRGNTRSCGCLRREHSKRQQLVNAGVERAEFDGICETLVESADRSPVAPRVLFSAVRNAWGSVDDRRLWRALRTMVDAGRLVRIGRRPSTLYQRSPTWPKNLASCISEAAATYAVLELGVRRAA